MSDPILESLLKALQNSFEPVPLPQRDPRKAAPAAQVPLPRPDPRPQWVEALAYPKGKWHERLPGSSPQPLSTDVWAPSMVLGAKGIDPSRKHGDAIDYNDKQMETWLAYPHMWRQDI